MRGLSQGIFYRQDGASGGPAVRLKIFVCRHAVERFQERVAELNDAQAIEAIQLGILGAGAELPAPGRRALIKLRQPFPCVAVLLGQEPQQRGPLVITILTSGMVKENQRWRKQQERRRAGCAQSPDRSSSSVMARTSGGSAVRRGRRCQQPL
jgi:hypothetical protein